MTRSEHFVDARVRIALKGQSADRARRVAASVARARARPVVCCLAAVEVVGAISPAGAGAATVSVTKDPQYPEFHEVVYVASQGERNNVSFVAVSDAEVRVSDPGAVITPRGGCTSIDLHQAACRGSDLDTAHVAAGDLDDVVTTPQRGDAWGDWRARRNQAETARGRA